MKNKLSTNGSRSSAPDPVDFMKQLIAVLGAMRDGEFSARRPSDWVGLEGKVAEHLAAISTRRGRFNTALLRVRREVGQEGKIGERLPLGDAVGGWADRIEAINALVDELTQPTVETGRVISAVAKGDLSQAMPLDVNGQPLKGEYLCTAKLVTFACSTAR